MGVVNRLEKEQADTHTFRLIIKSTKTGHFTDLLPVYMCLWYNRIGENTDIESLQYKHNTNRKESTQKNVKAKNFEILPRPNCTSSL